MPTIANLGFPYVPGSIRAHHGDQPISVDEADAEGGRIVLHTPEGFAGEVSIDFQRTLFRGGQPRRKKVLGEAVSCIYCGSKDDRSDEHIIPYALEGEFVIKKASCAECSRIISRVEEQVLRDALLAARTALRIRTYHPKQRPKTLPILLRIGETRNTLEVPVPEHPTYLALPIFELPAELRGDATPNLKVASAWVMPVSRVTLGEAARRLGGDVWVRTSMDIYAFARMLAKIAHGFVAISDLSDVQPYLTEAILRGGELTGRWVGGASEQKLGPEGLHNLAVEVIGQEIRVRIRLFAQLGGPEYLVLAGRMVGTH